jgi:predicted nuclease of restriction endonuclease-like RecB superfamily
MLTKELAIVSFENGQILPDRLVRNKHKIYVELASKMCDVYRQGIGKMRKSLHYDIHRILEEDPECPVRRIGAFCKLLDEWSEFDTGKPKQTAQLRQRVFRQAAAFHPLVQHVESILDHSEQSVKDQIALNENCTWLDLQEKLFSDIIEHQRLVRFQMPEETTDLLARYNVAQTQAVLMDATEVIVEARSDWKAILRYAKLAQLLHRIEPLEQGYRITLDGPASILRHTHRYGVQMAKFFPGLLACKSWKLTARISPKHVALANQAPWAKKRTWRLTLDDSCGLQSRAAPTEHTDSQLEADLIEEWQVMLLIESAPEQSQWRLIREGDLLVRGQRVFFPDFTIITPKQERILFEIVGFWTPEYLQHKQEVLHTFSHSPLLLAIPQSQKKQWESHSFSPSHKVLYFSQHLSPGEIIAAIEEIGS